MDARLKPRPDHNPVQHQSVPHTAFVQPGPDPDRSHDALSLQVSAEQAQTQNNSIILWQFYIL